MSAAAALLARARKAGVDVRVAGGDLLLRGKPDADLVQAIREAKGEIVALLTTRCSRGVLLAELKKLATRNRNARHLQVIQGLPAPPEGVDEARSAFICTWAHQSQTKLTPQQYRQAFNETLEGQDRIVRLDNGRLQLAEEKRHG